MRRRVVTGAVAAILLLGMALPFIVFPVQAQVPTLSIKPLIVPQRLPADSGSYPAIFVELTAPSGNAVEAPQDYQLFVTSSNQSVGTATSPLTISAGQTYGTILFKTTASQGSTTVTISGNGISPVSVQLITSTPTTSPSKLVVYIAPSTIVADGSSTDFLFIQLEDSNGIPSKSAQSLTVVTTSSNPSVLNVQSPEVIPAGSTLALSQLTSGTAPGNATITAQLNGFQSATATVRSVLLPISLQMTSNASGQIITGSTVRFSVTATSSGVPVKGAAVAWNFTSKAGTVVNDTLSTDSSGVAILFLRMVTGGNVTVTAAVSAGAYGSKTASETLGVKALVLSVQLIPVSLEIPVAGTTGVTAVVTSSGKPVQGASISWSSSAGSLTPSVSSTDASGTATVDFHGDGSGNATLTATASAPGYASGTGTVVIAVGQASGGGSGSQSSSFLGTAGIAAVAVVLIIAVLFVFRKRLPIGGRKEEEPAEESEGTDEDLSPEEPTVDMLRSLIERSSTDAE